jgi:hypothetical protein
MNKWQAMALICLSGIIILAGWWLKDGKEFYSKDKREVITRVKDEIFGGETEKREWVDDFRLGLLPGDPSPAGAMRSALVPSGALAAIGLLCLFKGRKK